MSISMPVVEYAKFIKLIHNRTVTRAITLFVHIFDYKDIISIQ